MEGCLRRPFLSGTPQSVCVSASAARKLESCEFPDGGSAREWHHPHDSFHWSHYRRQNGNPLWGCGAQLQEGHRHRGPAAVASLLSPQDHGTKYCQATNGHCRREWCYSHHLQTLLLCKRSQALLRQVHRMWLKDRQVILHTDGAKAYKLALSGVIHNNVVHKKKWLVVNGKQTWVRPHYTKLCRHTLPNGKEIRAKAGTQVIDRFRGHVRAYLKHAARRVGSCTLRRKIRAAQWTYWHRGENLWRATARMLQDLFWERACGWKKGVSYCHIATTHTHTADGSCTYVADLPFIHVQTKCRSWHLLLPCANSSD